MKPNIIIYPGDFWLDQENHTRRKDVESMVFSFIGANYCTDKNEYLVNKVYLPEDNEFSKRSLGGISLKVDSVLKVLSEVKKNSGLIDYHTHPDGYDHFSPTDERGHKLQMQNVFDFSSQGVLIRIVKERNRYRAEVTNRDLSQVFEPIDLIKIIGDKGIELVYPINSRIKLPSPDAKIDINHIRTTEFFKKEALDLISQFNLGIIGLGGNGSVLVNDLKFFPFNKFVLVDSDKLEQHNSNRFCGYNDGDAGHYKVEVLKREIKRFDSTKNVEIIRSAFPSEESVSALKDCDFIIVAPDNNAIRYEASKFAMRYLKPLIEVGSGITMDKGEVKGIGSQVRFQLPTKDGKCLACNGLDVRNLEPRELITYKKNIGYINNSEESPGSVITINSVCAALATHVMLNYFGNYIPREHTPTYIVYDERELIINDRSSMFKKNQECNLCGRHEGSIYGKGDFLPDELTVPLISEDEKYTGLISEICL